MTCNLSHNFCKWFYTDKLTSVRDPRTNLLIPPSTIASATFEEKNDHFYQQSLDLRFRNWT